MQKCDNAYLSKTGWNKLLVPYQFPLTCLFLFLFRLISKKLAHACFQLKCFSFSTLVDLFTAKKTKLQQCRQLHGVRVRILAPVFCPAALKCLRAANLGRANRCKYANPWAGGARDQGNC
jgi:hypothetical protein